MEISEWRRWFVGERWPFERFIGSVESRVISCGLVCGGRWILQQLPDSHHEAAAAENGSRAGAAASRLVSTRCDEKQDPEEEDGGDGAQSENTRLKFRRTIPLNREENAG